MKNLFISLVLLLSINSQAGLLTYESGPLKLENVVLNKTATVNASAKPEPVKMEILGAGVRKKLAIVKVYVLQLFSDNKAGFARDGGALTSIVSNSNNVTLKISMLRTVSAADLAASFSDALLANGYKVEGELQKLITVVQSGANGDEGKDLSLVLSKDTDPNIVNFSYEDSKGQIQSIKVGILAMTQVLSIWLGKPADSGLDSLKMSLLKPVY